MESPRTLKTIVRNMTKLYRACQFEDLLIYQRKLSGDGGLNRYDLAAVKQGFQHKLNRR